MTPNPELQPQTAAANNRQTNAYDADKVLFAATGTIAGAETISFYVMNSQNSRTPVYNAAGTQVQITATLQSVMLEGGYLYGWDKSATAGACGLDASFKPRISKP